jgi:hypothetical protein
VRREELALAEARFGHGLHEDVHEIAAGWARQIAEAVRLDAETDACKR